MIEHIVLKVEMEPHHFKKSKNKVFDKQMYDVVIACESLNKQELRDVLEFIKHRKNGGKK